MRFAPRKLSQHVGLGWISSASLGSLATQRAAYGLGQYICIGNISQKPYTLRNNVATELSTWTARLYKGVAFGHLGWCFTSATGGNASYFCTDGVTNPTAGAAPTEDYARVVYAGGHYFIGNPVSGATTSMQYKGGSDTAATAWNTLTRSGGNTRLQGAAFGAGVYVLVEASRAGVAGRLVTASTPAGLTDAAEHLVTATEDYNDVAFGSDRFVVLCNGGTGDILHSTTGLAGSFTRVTGAIPATCSRITHNGVCFVAVRSNSTAMYYSFNGLTWVAGGTLPNTTPNPFNNGQGEEGADICAGGDGTMLVNSTTSGAMSLSTL